MKVNCSHCGATCELTESSDGRCGICGSFLPEATDRTMAPEAREEEKPAPPKKQATQVPPESPPAEEPTDKGDFLIPPRGMAKEVENRVTAAWDSTHAQFRAPEETIRRSGATVEPPPVFITPRSVCREAHGQTGDYELLEVIGEGAMGTVWSAEQSSIGRKVAVKIPKSGAIDARNLFMCEVVVSGQLDHPNIVPIYDLARDEKTDELFYSMKHVKGTPWSECMHGKTGDRTLTSEENLEVLMKVCDAIRFTHARGIIHRDIKPDNIVVGSFGEVSVMDFGIAVRKDELGPDSSYAKSSPAGTPAYMAPEMAAPGSGPLGDATDVYLLGAVLYEIITGQPPHPRSTNLSNAVLNAARNEIVQTEQTGELVEIAKRAMQTEPSNRYPTVAEFQDAIREYRSHAESIKLVERGEEHLQEAQANGRVSASRHRFDEYDRARFAFEEAGKLWEQNSAAKDGLGRTLLAYAEYAYRTKNYIRGIDLLDEENKTHRPLLEKLKTALRRQEDNDRMRKRLIAAVIIAVAVIAVGGTIGSAVLYNAKQAEENQRRIAEDNEAKAELARQNEEEQRKIAEDNEAKAILARKNEEEQRKIAEDNEAKAILARKNEEEQRKIAEDNEKTALAEKNRAETSSYAFEIGQAAAAIQRNAYESAAEILSDHRPTFNDLKSKLRNWEWGYLEYLATKPVEAFGDATPFENDRVESTAISQDGTWIVAGTNEGNVYVWRRRMNQRRTALTYGDTVHAVALSDDARFVAAAGANEGVKIWELPVNDGAPPTTIMPVRKAEILSLAFAAQGKQLLVSAADRTAELWDLNAQALIGVFRGHNSAVTSASFSHDERYVVTAGEDGTVRVWLPSDDDPEEKFKEVRRFVGHRGPVYAAEFSPNDNYVISGGHDGSLLVWDATDIGSAREFRKISAEVVDGRLRAERPPAEASVRQLGQHNATIRSITLAKTSEEADIVVSASNDNTVRVWDFAKRFTGDALLKELRGHSNWVRSCGYFVDEDNREWVLSGGYDGRVQLWDWKRYEIARVLRYDPEGGLVDPHLTSAAWSPDGRWIFTTSKGGVVTVWDVLDPARPAPQRLREGHAALSTTGILFDDGKSLLTAGGDNGTCVWEVDSGRELLRLGNGWFEKGAGTGWRGVAAVSHDGRWIATGSDDPSRQVIATIWDLHTGQRVVNVPPASRRDDVRFVSLNEDAMKPTDITALAFSQDDQLLFVGDDEGACYLVDRESGQETDSNQQVHARKVTEAIFLSDGRHLLTSSADGSVVKWDVQARKLRQVTSLRHGDRVVDMAVSADGRILLSATVTRDLNAPTLRLWDVEAGDEMRALPLNVVVNAHVDAPEEIKDPEEMPAIRSVALHPSGEHAVVTVFVPEDSKYYIGRWNWVQRQYREIRGKLQNVSRTYYMPNGESYLTVGGRGANVSDDEWQPVMSYRLQREVQFASFSHDSQYLVCAGADGMAGTLKIWVLDPANRQWKSGVKVLGGQRLVFKSAVFHPQRNDVMLTASDDGSANLWRRADETWEMFGTIDGHGENAMHRAIFSPDGSRVLTMSADNTAKVWNWDLAGTITPLKTLPHEPSSAGVLCGDFSDDGNWIATASGSKVRIWKADWDNQQIEQVEALDGFSGHTQDITSIAFAHGEGAPHRLLTGSRDFTVRLWDTSALANAEITAESFRQLLTLEEHTGEVTSVAFSSHNDGLYVLTAGKDGQAIIWPSVPIE